MANCVHRLRTCLLVTISSLQIVFVFKFMHEHPVSSDYRGLKRRSLVEVLLATPPGQENLTVLNTTMRLEEVILRTSETTTGPPQTTSGPTTTTAELLTTSAPPPSAADPSKSAEQAVLLYCVPSATRPSSSYLTATLGSLSREISLPSAKNGFLVEVLVVDVSSHEAREDIAQARAAYPSFKFEPIAGKTFENCSAEMMRTDHGDGVRPPCSVRQQTRDVTAAMEQCAGRAGPAGWVSLMEDDTELCQGGVAFMTRILAAMVATGRKWQHASFARFFSGITLPQNMAVSLARHARNRAMDKPIDHSVLEKEKWGGGGVIFDTDANLFAHRGKVSTFEYRNEQSFRDQYDKERFSGYLTECQLPDIESQLRKMQSI